MPLEHDERAAFQGEPSRHLFPADVVPMLRLRTRPYDNRGPTAQSTSVMGGRTKTAGATLKERIENVPHAVIPCAR